MTPGSTSPDIADRSSCRLAWGSALSPPSAVPPRASIRPISIPLVIALAPLCSGLPALRRLVSEDDCRWRVCRRVPDPRRRRERPAGLRSGGRIKRSVQRRALRSADAELRAVVGSFPHLPLHRSVFSSESGSAPPHILLVG